MKTVLAVKMGKNMERDLRWTEVESLSDHELLTALLGKGARLQFGKQWFHTAYRLLEATGGLQGLSRCELTEFTRLGGITESQALLIKICIELGKRLAHPGPPIGKPIASSFDVANWYKGFLQDHTRECIFALLLDNKNRPVKNLRVSEGTWTSCMFDPKIVLSACLRLATPSLILIHNHPSGDPTPSRNDLEITERMIRACQIIGIRLLDHLIVGREGYTSLSDTGLM